MTIFNEMEPQKRSGMLKAQDALKSSMRWVQNMTGQVKSLVLNLAVFLCLLDLHCLSSLGFIYSVKIVLGQPRTGENSSLEKVLKHHKYWMLMYWRESNGSSVELYISVKRQKRHLWNLKGRTETELDELSRKHFCVTRDTSFLKIHDTYKKKYL